MKLDGRAVMGAVAKSTGHAFYFFHLGVDRLSQGIGDAMLGVGHDVVDMDLEGLSRFLDGSNPRMRGPEVPAFK
jgi:hypothetical protein